MTRKQPTIYDVARLAGVSISTVSRVLNQPQRVNQQTLEAVQAAIDSLGFVPKAEARARALKDTGRIGVLTPFFAEPSFTQRLRGISAALQQTSYEMVIYPVDSQRRLNGYLQGLPITRNLDGLIMISIHLTMPQMEMLTQYGMPVVVIEDPHELASTVEFDNPGGGRMAADLLTGRGHRQLGFVGVPDTDLPDYSIHPVYERLTGFRTRLAELGIRLAEEHVSMVAYDLETTSRVASSMLQTRNCPTAIFAGTDLQALGVLKACRQLQLRVPQDVAVLGFDDIDISAYVGLSTIRQPLDESGRVAAELLLSRIADPGRLLQHVLLPLTLIERETT
ncbi:MAG TPA: LacI family DNA-binding transcriptional regulator [Anaerolineaceae bacterium]|nr:LacI family transcriptional regulator [Chloroflexota bacterium]HOU44822.1 LacI family DNA-binding transcriptional regulator [Anaerolineaceae bacterium]